jgi:hypothetical protein
MNRAFVFVATTEPETAAQAVAAAPAPPDVCVVSPSAAARRTAAYALSGRWVPMFDDPLLEAPVAGESEDDVRARMVEALRDIDAYSARAAVLVVCDRLDFLAPGAFIVDEGELVRLADDLERSLTLP